MEGRYDQLLPKNRKRRHHTACVAGLGFGMENARKSALIV
jgi:hypothetical protein